MQVDDESPALEVLAVSGIEHRPASGGEDDVIEGGELLDGLRLALAKAVLALDLEDHGDRDAGPFLDIAVGVVERLSQALGELPSDGGLARAHHAHEENPALGLHSGIVAIRRLGP